MTRQSEEGYSVHEQRSKFYIYNSIIAIWLGIIRSKNPAFVVCSFCVKSLFKKRHVNSPSIVSQCLFAMQSLQETNVWLCWCKQRQ